MRLLLINHLAQKIGLAEQNDEASPKRKQGASVGEYMLLAAINRAVHPVSKHAFADWYADTSLPCLMGVAPSQLTSQRFWDHMDRLDEVTIQKIEQSITHRLADQFQLDLRNLVYDATNFYTWIDTLSEEELPQRGHNKAKRNDLKQVGLALTVTADFHIPLFHQVYVGNRTDSKQFSGVLAHRLTKPIFGVTRTVVITYNESLYLGQKQGLLLQQK